MLLPLLEGCRGRGLLIQPHQIGSQQSRAGETNEAGPGQLRPELHWIGLARRFGDRRAYDCCDL